MSVPRCITIDDYRNEAEKILNNLGVDADKISVEYLARYLQDFWIDCEKYSGEIGGSFGYGRNN